MPRESFSRYHIPRLRGGFVTLASFTGFILHSEGIERCFNKLNIFGVSQPVLTGEPPISSPSSFSPAL